VYRRQRRIVAAGYAVMLLISVGGLYSALSTVRSVRLAFTGGCLLVGWVTYIFMSRGRLRLAGATITDPLTGLYNRRYLMDRLAEESSRTQRYGGRFAVAMVDLDDFKQVNETQGHAAGDAALRALGGFLIANLRRVDLIFRYGGEEFVAVMPDTDGPAGAEGLLRLEESLGALRLAFSAGVASFPVDGRTPEVLLRRADARLHLAKRAGKGRVIWNDAGAEPLAADTAG
jgi:diguanylate cyclase (GGDEF)-like protein